MNQLEMKQMNPNTLSALRRLRMRHLELLCHLSEETTVSAAATRLNLTQPAVSKMITEIESVCNAALFTRGRTGITANDKGFLLIQTACDMVQSLDRSLSEIQTLEDGATGLLRMGSFSTTSIFPRLVTNVIKKLPNLKIQIQESPPQELINALINHQLDCVVTSFSREMMADERTKSLKLQPISTDSLCVVASTKHPLAKRRNIRWSEAVNFRWALPPKDALMTKELMYALKKMDCPDISPVIESMSAITMKGLIQFDDNLLGIMREHQAKEEVRAKNLVILPINPKIKLPDICLVTQKQNLIPTTTMQALLDWKMLED
ncbi:MAG: LysR family transcriptional regulator [Burkholderiaceae bacterium]|nr:LysR family transcriptional regulator [Burkholderiaceae bacterium]